MWIKNNNQKNERNQNHENQRFTYRVFQQRFLSFNHDRNINNKFKINWSRKKCFLCDDDHKVKNYDLLRKLKKFVKQNQEKIKTNKNKKTSRNYNVEIFLMNNNNFINVNFDNEENMKEIVVLFKKLINKIFKSNWIADINVLFHIINQFRLFNEFFISIKKRTIKIKKRILHSNQCETIIIKIKNDEYQLTNVLYVFNLKINLLFEKRFMKRNLRKSFDDNDLYMHIT